MDMNYDREELTETETQIQETPFHEERESILSTRMRIAREDLGYTQSGIASEVNTKTSTYKRWESGETEMKVDKLCEFGEFTGVSVDWLLGKTDQKFSHTLSYELDQNQYEIPYFVDRRTFPDFRGMHFKNQAEFNKRFENTEGVKFAVISNEWNEAIKPTSILLGLILYSNTNYPLLGAEDRVLVDITQTMARPNRFYCLRPEYIGHQVARKLVMATVSQNYFTNGERNISVHHLPWNLQKKPESVDITCNEEELNRMMVGRIVHRAGEPKLLNP
tara:strand:- start:46 stop:873 length:828 start_codon:yes stop_codon:yes gene_type:complete